MRRPPRNRPQAAHVGAFLIAFVGSVAMWWIYFNIGAERGSHQIAHSDDPGRIARAVYTHFHIPIVAGIVVCAVADEITIKHPVGHMELSAAATLLGGPALYLAGNLLVQACQRQALPALTPRGPRAAVAADTRRHGPHAARARCRDHRGAGTRGCLGDTLVRGRSAPGVATRVSL